MRIEYELWCDASRLVDEQCMKTTLLAGFVVWGCVTAANALPPRYEVEFLAAGFDATAMSRSGTSAGYFFTENDVPGQSLMALFTDRVRPIETIENDESAFVNSVNDAGELVGSYLSSQTGSLEVPFIATESSGITFLSLPQGRQGSAV